MGYAWMVKLGLPLDVLMLSLNELGYRCLADSREMDAVEESVFIKEKGLQLPLSIKLWKLRLLWDSAHLVEIDRVHVVSRGLILEFHV